MQRKLDNLIPLRYSSVPSLHTKKLSNVIINFHKETIISETNTKQT